MKKLYITLFLVTLAVTSFSQTFYVFTAKNSGLWTQSSNWTTTPRTDGVPKNKVVIPANITIIADNNVDNLGLGDVQINVFGVMAMSPNVNLHFSENSSIELNSGAIVGIFSSQRIRIGNDTKYKGSNDGIVSGNYYADKTTGASPNGFRSMAMLPVNFTSFYISKSAQTIQLTWSTDTEINNSHFDVERSFDGLEWHRIANITGSGNSTITKNYSYNDKNVSAPVVYYRIRQVDIDGRALYTSIKTIRASEAISAVKIYGSAKNVVIDLNQAIKNNLLVTVLNTNGQVISRQTVVNPQYRIELNLGSVATGAYIIQVTDNKGWTVTKKIVL